MASLVRKEFDCSTAANMVERTNLLVRQAARLKYIAETFNIPVRPVVVHQATSICAWKMNDYKSDCASHTMYSVLLYESPFVRYVTLSL